MDLSEHVEALRAHLRNVAAAGDDRTRETARLLADTLEPAVRLAVLDALVEMAGEVTAAWDGGSVDIRLRGRDPEVVVTPVGQGVSTAAGVAPGDGAPPEVAAGPVSRVSLRLPGSHKGRVESAAAAAGVSVNTWLVRAVTAGVGATPADTPRRRSAHPATSPTGS